MSSSSSIAALPGGNRFAVITDDDHTGILWIVSILCLIYAFMIFALRLEARRKNFGLDDIFAIVGTLLASIQYILIFVANRNGLGKSHALTSTFDAAKSGQYLQASQALLLLALGLAKCSVISLCRRLFSFHIKSHRVICDVAVSMCALWSVGSLLAVTVDCSALRLIGYNAEFCNNLSTRWTAIGILDSLTELGIVAMAFYGLWPLQMSLSRKLQALSAFILRLINIIFATLHITTLRDAISSTNPGVALAIPTTYLQIELLYSLLSVSIPALNRWLRNFDTSMGSTWMHSSQAYSLNNSKTGRSESEAMALESMEKNVDPSKRWSRLSRSSMVSKSLPKRSSAAIRSEEFVPSGSKYSVTTRITPQPPSAGSRDRPVSDSVNSEDMIIRKDVHWNVQYEQSSLHRDSN